METNVSKLVYAGPDCRKKYVAPLATFLWLDV